MKSARSAVARGEESAFRTSRSVFRRRSVFAIHCVAIAACLLPGNIRGFAMPADEFNYDESKVPPFVLPDPLIRADGAAVSTSDEWLAHRRPEVLHLFEEHVFGKLPPLPPQLRWRLQSAVTDAVNGLAVRREITVFFTDDDAGPRMDLMIYSPVAANGRVPAFLGYNFNGNHTVEADPRIRLTDSWVRDNEAAGTKEHRATEAGRGSSSSRWDLPAILQRGYGLITIYYGDIDPDFDDGFHNGIHALFPQAEGPRAPDAGGSISAWAWGLSRALDVLQHDPHIDAQRVALFGHSRLGKTSLWAGATDQRFAMVISNDSGCGGAALSRRRFGETVARINTSFPHWFCVSHRSYNNNEDALPVDQHMLIALAAPRPVYVASAEDDRWADPRGEFLSLYYAGPVFALFGRQGLPSIEMPAVNSPVQTDVAYHIRTGKHDVTSYDWEQYLNFADSHLK